MDHRIFHRCKKQFWTLIAVVFFSPAMAFSQDDSDTLGPPKPILIANLSNLEQSLTDIGTMFELSDRADMKEVIDGFLDDKAGSLKGLDRKRPLGMMLFLEETLPPTPRPVAYLPIENEDDFIGTLRLAAKSLSKKSDGVYEIRERHGRSTQVRIRDGYAFISIQEKDGTFLEREIPRPEVVAAGLSSRYDGAISLQIRNLPSGLREVFIGMFRAQVNAELQQRDHETASAYKARRATGESMATLIEQVLRDGQEITLGVDSAPDGSRTVFELVIDALPESEFSRYLKGIGGSPSHFEPLASETNPLSILVGWNMDKRQKTLFSSYVESFQTGVQESHERSDEETTSEMVSAVGLITDSLRVTVEQGRSDFVFQLLPQANKDFVLLYGLKISEGNTFSTGLYSLLKGISEKQEDDALQITLNAHEYRQAVFHRLAGRFTNDEGLQRMFGSEPVMHMGVGGGVLWITFGSGGSMPTAERAIDALLSASPGTRTGSTAPLQVIFRMLPWMQLQPDEHADPIVRELITEGMSADTDSFRLEVRPTETGGRVQLQFDGGFIKLGGLLLAHFYDQSQL